VVPPRRKLGLAAGALSAAVIAPARRNDALAPLPAIRYLVEAGASRTHAPRSFYDRTVWVIEMFERVAQRDRLERLVTSRADAPADG
jgi:hypothetical protein